MIIHLFAFADLWDKVLMGVGTLAAIANGLTIPVMILTRGRVIDNFAASESLAEIQHRVTENSLTYVYVALAALFASYLEVYCWMATGVRQATRVRILHMEAMLRQDVGCFDDGEAGGGSSSNMLLFQDAISEKAGSFIRDTTQFLACYLIGFTQSWRLAVVVLPFTPLLVLPGFIFGKTVTTFEGRKVEAYKKAESISKQALSSIRTVYSFCMESSTLDAYSRSLEPTVALGVKQGIAQGLSVGSGGLSFGIWSLLAWIGSLFVMRHQATGSQVITTGLALFSGGRSLGFAISTLKTFAEGKVAADNIFRAIKRVHLIANSLDGMQLTTVLGNVRLDNVIFSYASRPKHPVLNGLSLDIPAGKRVALAGRSGCGKSTVISLLERFYDPLEGCVLLDGIDVKRLQLKWFRQQIGLVSQEPALFATTIKENILYGKEDASDQELISAAKAANAHNFIISLPNGYDTQVGEKGTQISGGQKQRIAIARALIRLPRVLLLDEATSALDTESEKAVQAALDAASCGRTTVIVAHRLNTIRQADIIAVLDSGRIVELGPHEQLISQGGFYSRQVELDEESRHNKKQVEAELHQSEDENVQVHSTEDVAGEQTAAMGSSRGPSIWRMFGICSNVNWKMGILGAIGAAGFGVLQPLCALVFGSMVTVYYLPDHELKREINKYSCIFAGLAAAALALNVIQHYNFAIVGENVTKRLREVMLGQMLKFEVAWFDEADNTSGSLCSRLASDANGIRALICDRMASLLQTLSSGITCLIAGVFVSWKLGLVMASIQPLMVACYYVKVVFLKGFSKEAAKAHNEASQIATEALSQHRTVTAFSLQGKMVSLLQSKLQTTVRQNTTRSNVAGLGLGIAHFILYSSWGLQFWYGGKLFVHGEASFSDVFKVYFIYIGTGRIIAETLSLVPDFAKGATAVESVLGITDRKPKIDAEKGRGGGIQIRGKLDICNVEFYYPCRPRQLVFKDLSLHVAAGQSLGLAGPSGSGKSTIIGLIQRFYDPVKGSILIDGEDIRNLHLKSVRKQIGLVSQEPVLFAASIRENMAYGRPEADEAEIQGAARVANAHEFISALPDGYDTYAGEGGVQLSGGQKQRIAIARAMLKKPAILLLDEATSALDTQSEHLVKEALDRMMKWRTSIVIAHRLSTIRNCDNIAVIQHGRVVEQGTHDQLICKAEDGIYSSLIGSANV